MDWYSGKDEEMRLRVYSPNGQFDLNLFALNAQQRYYDKLAGVTEPSENQDHRRRICPYFWKRPRRLKVVDRTESFIRI